MESSAGNQVSTPQNNPQPMPYPQSSLRPEARVSADGDSRTAANNRASSSARANSQEAASSRASSSSRATSRTDINDRTGAYTRTNASDRVASRESASNRTASSSRASSRAVASERSRASARTSAERSARTHNATGSRTGNRTASQRNLQEASGSHRTRSAEYATSARSSRDARHASALDSQRSSAARRSHNKSSSQSSRGLIVALAIAALALIGLIVFGFSRCAASSASSDSQPANPVASLLTGGNDQSQQQRTDGRFSNKLDGSTETTDEHGIVHGVTPSGIRYTVHGRDSGAYQQDKVTLAAVGDQVVSDNALYLAQANAGGNGYDFSPFYQEIGPYLRQFDLRYINQETTCATSRGYSVRGYPVFNSPDSAIEAIAAEQFNMVNFNSNHSWDCGSDGVEATHEVFDRYPEILLAGSYLTQEDRETVHMIERNGITFAFLSYCYGYNGFEPDNDYYTCEFDEALITADIERAKSVADVIIVAMHWGDEYITTVSDYQAYWAGFLADLDVDLVLGSHAHIMQPVEYVTGSSGNTIPVVYGLSDIISGWTLTDTILSGIVTCDFVPQSNGEVTLENLTWHPTIEWSDGGTVSVRMLENMSDEEIAANTRTEDVADDVPYLHEIINSCIQQIPTTW